MIFTSITPFGQSGPRRDWKGTDLTLQARSGLQYLFGDPDRAPVRISVPLIATKAGVEAASSSLFALFHRNRTGKGQRVDVSIQAVGIWQMMNASSFPKHHGVNQTRSEGKLPDVMRGKKWEEWDMAKLATDKAAQQEMDDLNETIAEFLTAKSKWEIFERACNEKILAARVNNVKDLVAHPQPNARGGDTLAHEDLNAEIVYPGHWTLMNNARAGPRFRTRMRSLG